MSIASDFVPFFVTQRTDRYVDTVTVNRTTARGTFNTTTGVYDTPTVSEPYTGGALIRPRAVRDVDFGQTQTQRGVFDVYLPDTATGIDLEDRITVDTSTIDPDLTGAVLTVTEVDKDTYLTHRRVTAELDEGTGNP